MSNDLAKILELWLEFQDNHDGPHDFTNFMDYLIQADNEGKL